MPELNPFTPTFGKAPPFAAGRDNVLADMAYAFDNGSGDPNLPWRQRIAAASKDDAYTG